MTLIELNKIVEGNYAEEMTEASKQKYRCATDQELQLFKSMLMMDAAYQNALKMTESHKEFYETYSFFRLSFPDEIKEDLFYATKLGFRYEGIPTRLVYLLRKALLTHDSPNLAISAINKMSWGRFLKRGSLPNGVTIKMIVENLLGESYDTILDYRLKVKYKRWYEVYVSNVDRIALLPEEIAQQIEETDIRSIMYTKDVGLTLYEKPLRTFGSFYGIISHEFDLRKIK